jgi:hypothetical protein
MFNIREPILEGRLDSTWHAIVQFYTYLDLTYEKDRLPALSGIASQLFPESDYLAGLRRKSLLYDLCWRRFPFYTLKNPVLRQSGIPSWSWAAIKSPVWFREYTGIYTGLGLEIIKAACSLETKNLFGRVSSGYLAIRGAVLKATLLPLVSSKVQYLPQGWYRQHILLPGQQTVKDEYLTFYPDSSEFEESYLSSQAVLLLSCFSMRLWRLRRKFHASAPQAPRCRSDLPKDRSRSG